jgi:hypothetical protein
MIRLRLRSRLASCGLVRTNHDSGHSVHFLDGRAVTRLTAAPAAVIEQHNVATVEKHRFMAR